MNKEERYSFYFYWIKLTTFTAQMVKFYYKKPVYYRIKSIQIAYWLDSIHSSNVNGVLREYACFSSNINRSSNRIQFGQSTFQHACLSWLFSMCRSDIRKKGFPFESNKFIADSNRLRSPVLLLLLSFELL